MIVLFMNSYILFVLNFITNPGSCFWRSLPWFHQTLSAWRVGQKITCGNTLEGDYHHPHPDHDHQDLHHSHHHGHHQPSLPGDSDNKALAETYLKVIIIIIILTMIIMIFTMVIVMVIINPPCPESLTKNHLWKHT